MPAIGDRMDEAYRQHGLFADVSDEVRERVTSGTFNELFRVPAQTPAQASV